MSKIKIAEMLKRGTVEDTDLLICEDDLDTKQTTVRDLKRCLNGDVSEPSEYKFYSSSKVEDLFTGVDVQLSQLPTSEAIDKLVNKVTNLIQNSTGSGEKDAEIIAARGTYPTLDARLDAQESDYDKRYLRNKTNTYYGNKIDLHSVKKANMVISLDVNDNITKDTTISVDSANLLSISSIDSANVRTDETGYQFKYSSTMYEYKIPCSLPLGDYTLYGNYEFSDDFIKDGFTLKLYYADGSTSSLNFGFVKVYRFTVTKSLSHIAFVPNKMLINDGMALTVYNMMISEYSDLDEYITGGNIANYNVTSGTTFSPVTLEAGNCIVTRSEGSVKVVMTDISYTTDDILAEIEELRQELDMSKDHCGLIEQQGTYIFADTAEEDSEGLCKLSKDYDMMRNNHCSLKMQYMEHDPDDFPRITIPLETPLNLEYSTTFAIQFYIDKTTFEHFKEEDGIKVMLSSDYVIANPSANYYFFNFVKDSFVQGWNTITVNLDKFLPHGLPDWSNINQINLRFYSCDYTNGDSIYINSFIIDQRMMPTVLFAFDDFDEEGFDYGYPYLYSRDIPATIFANNKKTLTREYLNKVCDLVYSHGWEIGCNGVNPDKEIMTEDDNPREQYMSLRETRQWLIDNFQDSIVSYSAPYGDLRPISMKILKSMGFKIAKATADNFCSFFADEDFVIPMHLLSNESGHGADDICEKLDTIVETGQVLCIYTTGVSRYGNEIQANKVSFEKVIEKIEMYREQGRLQCLTFQDFYKKCCK